VIGLSARQPAIVPGNRHVFGFIQRQYTRRVSNNVGLVQAPVFERLRERFDIVSFDPHGVGRSRRVICDEDFRDMPTDADDETLAAFFDVVSQRFARACLERNGPFVTTIGTNSVARDMDMLRRALGEQQISYAAGSYGSELGAVYASLFPQRVRAMMLDGAVAPEFRDYLVEWLSEFSGAAEMAFQRVDQACRRDPACRLAGTGVVATFDELAAQLDSAPIPSSNGQMLTHDALRGRPGASRSRDQLAIDRQCTCRCTVRQLRAAAWAIAIGGQQWRRLDAGLVQRLRHAATGGGLLARRRGHRRAPPAVLRTLLRRGEHCVVRGLADCRSRRDPQRPWPNDGADSHHRQRFRSANEFERCSSPARALGMESSVLRYTGGGHTAFFTTTACVQDTAIDYLVQLRLLPEGFTCPGRTVAFSPSSAGSKTALTTTNDSWFGLRAPSAPRNR
jgi:pimeloyl-ACP methyl ester carboxylesterase